MYAISYFIIVTALFKNFRCLDFLDVKIFVFFAFVLCTLRLFARNFKFSVAIFLATTKKMGQKATKNHARNLKKQIRPLGALFIYFSKNHLKLVCT